MEDGVFYGMVLNLFEDSHLLLAVIVELYGKDVGCVDELANAFLSHGEVSGDKTFAIIDFNDFFTGVKSAGVGECDHFTTVEDNGDLLIFAETFCGLLSEVGARLGCEFKQFHQFVN